MLYNSSIGIVFWYFCMLSEKCQNMVKDIFLLILFYELFMQIFQQGEAVTRALHTTSDYYDSNYQRFVRIFSLQIKEQPIRITMKQMFTFNHSLLKSVCLNYIPIRELNLLKQTLNILLLFLHLLLDNCFSHNLCFHCDPIPNI